jgi:hypothetical protein
LTNPPRQRIIAIMKNRQVLISIKYGSVIHKKAFSEHDAAAYVTFLESSGLWYEVEEASEEENFDEGCNNGKKDKKI